MKRTKAQRRVRKRQELLSHHFRKKIKLYGGALYEPFTIFKMSSNQTLIQPAFNGTTQSHNQ